MPLAQRLPPSPRHAPGPRPSSFPSLPLHIWLSGLVSQISEVVQPWSFSDFISLNRRTPGFTHVVTNGGTFSFFMAEQYHGSRVWMHTRVCIGVCIRCIVFIHWSVVSPENSRLRCQAAVNHTSAGEFPGSLFY